MGKLVTTFSVTILPHRTTRKAVENRSELRPERPQAANPSRYPLPLILVVRPDHQRFPSALRYRLFCRPMPYAKIVVD